MVFVAQLDLAALAPYDPHRLLPEQGLLSFFAGDYEDGVVLFSADASAVVPAKAPHGVVFGKLPTAAFPACGVRLRGGMSAPQKVESDEDGGWFDVWEGHRSHGGEEALHRVLGHDFGDTEGGDAEDIVLLALGSDDRAKMQWGDAGVLYFCIDPAVLAKRDWKRVYVVSTD
jgi:hypothetical protein